MEVDADFHSGKGTRPDCREWLKTSQKLGAILTAGRVPSGPFAFDASKLLKQLATSSEVIVISGLSPPQRFQ
jgi:uncharacterized protein YciI